MASTIFIISSLPITITDTNTDTDTTGIYFLATLLLPNFTILKNSPITPIKFGFFRPISESAAIGAAFLWGRLVLSMVLGLCDLHIGYLCIIKGIFSVQGGNTVHGEGSGMENDEPNITNEPVVPQREGKGKEKVEDEDEDTKKDEEGLGGGGGGDTGKDPEDGGNKWADATVEIRKFLNETDVSIGVFIDDIHVGGCPSWTNLAQRIHDVWKWTDKEDGDLVEENVDPSTCWPGYEVSYWSADKQSLNWNQVEWHHAIQRLKLVRLVPFKDPFSEDQGKDPEDGEIEWADATVEIRQFLTETDISIGMFIEEILVGDCPSWTSLAKRVHDVWTSVDRGEEDLVKENVDPDTCWPGYKVSYWTADKQRLNWKEVEWHLAIRRLKVVRLVPIMDPFSDRHPCHTEIETRQTRRGCIDSVCTLC